MSFLHEEYGTDAEIYRKPLGTEVIADSSDPQAHQILKSCGFVEKMAPPVHVWHRLPEGLDTEEEMSRATRAMYLLRGVGFDAHMDESLCSPPAHDGVIAEQRHRAEISAAATSSSPAGAQAPPAGPVSAVSPSFANIAPPAAIQNRRGPV
ncbi:hypothetical protein ACFV5N_00190 [Streptomyces sp. NPDC059853]|uniref:hypothetical protein n=1 Tax=Streptomyces sp. NPDC059853 TaxID=3346973 RepID=UPI00364AB834